MPRIFSSPTKNEPLDVVVPPSLKPSPPGTKLRSGGRRNFKLRLEEKLLVDLRAMNNKRKERKKKNPKVEVFTETEMKKIAKERVENMSFRSPKEK
jgi:hypothetical protein